MNIKRKGVVFVSPKGETWKVQTSGTTKAAGIFSTKASAQKRGREIAKSKRAELIVQKKNGEIQMRNSYGSDPFPPKG